MRRSTAILPLLTAVLLAVLLAVAGCTGGGSGGPSGDGPGTITAAPSAPAEEPAETRTVTERPSATVTEREPESPPPEPGTTTVAPPPDVAPQGEACLATTAQPAIQQGSSGPAVVKAQCYLNLALSGASIPEDGDFGPVTDDSVRRFQECAGLTVDGLVGPQTWPELVFWADAGPVC